MPEIGGPWGCGGRSAPPPKVSVVIPCLNEAENIEECVSRALAAIEAGGFSGEVVVADNNSTDGSGALAEAAGARVVHESRPGYGSAYLAGCRQVLEQVQQWLLEV